MSPTLTPLQAEVLGFIRNFQAFNGYAPSLLEICKEFGWASKTAAGYHIRTLARKGWLRRVPGTARALQLVRVRQ